MRLKELRTGQKVEIIKGNYTGRPATFQGPAGVMGLSAKVAIQGDDRPHRTLRLASLKLGEPSVRSLATTHSNGSPTVDRNPADLESVI